MVEWRIVLTRDNGDNGFEYANTSAWDNFNNQCHLETDTYLDMSEYRKNILSENYNAKLRFKTEPPNEGYDVIQFDSDEDMVNFLLKYS